MINLNHTSPFTDKKCDLFKFNQFFSDTVQPVV